LEDDRDTRRLMKKKLLVIVVAGLPGAGKSIVGEVAERIGYIRLVMGDVVRGEAQKRGLKPTREVLSMIARDLRERYGDAVIAERLVTKISVLFEEKEGGLKIIIDGVRSLSEVKCFQENIIHRVTRNSSIKILAIHASPRTRYHRLIARGRGDDPKNWEEFCRRDFEELSLGLGDVIALADYMIINENKDLEALKKEIEDVLIKIEREESFEDTSFSRN